MARRHAAANIMGAFIRTSGGSWNRTNPILFKRQACRRYTLPPVDRVGPVGVEPTTTRLKVECATTCATAPVVAGPAFVLAKPCHARLLPPVRGGPPSVSPKVARGGIEPPPAA